MCRSMCSQRHPCVDDVEMRRGQDFISYLKAFLMAPVLRVEQNSEAIAAVIAGNPAFYVTGTYGV